MSALVYKEGPLSGSRIELAGELVIGREDAGLTIDDAEASRRHAVVRVSGTTLEIEDLGSRNGTFVNGRRITGRVRLARGDSVRIGRTVFEVEPAGAAETAASPVAAVAAPARSDVPAEPFGAFAAPPAPRSHGGIASRQLVPMLLSWAVVASTAAALIVYFAKH